MREQLKGWLLAKVNPPHPGKIDFRTAFETVSHHSLTWELRKPKLNKQKGS